MSTSFPFFGDARGTLVPIELDDVPFEVRRIFTVAGVAGGSVRGNHRSGCRELIVLVAGRVRLEIGTDPDVLTPATLVTPGQTVDVPAGSFVRYALRDEQSVILVLADAAYEPDREGRT